MRKDRVIHNAFKDWGVVYFQVFSIIIVFLLFLYPGIAGRTKPFLKVLLSWDLSDDLLSVGAYGSFLIALVVSILLLKTFNEKNSHRTLNTGNYYHNHTYFGYWICSNILGFGKCNLYLVPAPMQYKLVIRDTFEEYVYENVCHEIKGDDIVDCKPEGNIREHIKGNIVNLIISDTYVITNDDIPSEVEQYENIIISRTIKHDKMRYKSESLIKTVSTVVRQLPSYVDTINVLGTLNPYNCYRIVNEIFKTGCTGAIENLIVYKQDTKTWKFVSKGERIYGKQLKEINYERRKDVEL